MPNDSLPEIDPEKMQQLQELLQQSQNPGQNTMPMPGEIEQSDSSIPDESVPPSGMSGDANDPSQASNLVPVSQSPMMASNQSVSMPLPSAGPTPEQATTPAPTPPPSDKDALLNSLRAKYGIGQNPDAMRNAQISSGIVSSLGALGDATEQMGRGMAGLPYKPNNSELDRVQQNAQRPLQQMMEQRKMQQENMGNEAKIKEMAKKQEDDDPKSDVSKSVQGFYKNLLTQSGSDPEAVKSIDDMSAADLKQYGTSPLEVASRLKTMLMAKQMQTEALKAKTAEAVETKRTKTEDDASKTTLAQLEQMRGNPAVQQAEKDLYSVSKAEGLANLYGDPNKLSPQQSDLYVSEIAKIATGGVPTAAEISGLKSGAAVGRLARVWSEISNEPQPANAGEFIKAYQDYSKKLKEDAQVVIKDRYGRILEVNSRKLNPADKKAFEAQFTNRFSQSEQSPAPLTPKDQQAMDWAAKNPTDPRAKKIIQMHGAK